MQTEEIIYLHAQSSAMSKVIAYSLFWNSSVMISVLWFHFCFLTRTKHSFLIQLLLGIHDFTDFCSMPEVYRSDLLQNCLYIFENSFCPSSLLFKSCYPWTISILDHKYFTHSSFPYHFYMPWFYFSLFNLFTFPPLDNTFIEVFIVIANLWLSNKANNWYVLTTSGNSFSLFPWEKKNQNCFLQSAQFQCVQYWFIHCTTSTIMLLFFFFTFWHFPQHSAHLIEKIFIWGWGM